MILAPVQSGTMHGTAQTPPPVVVACLYVLIEMKEFIRGAATFTLMHSRQLLQIEGVFSWERMACLSGRATSRTLKPPSRTLHQIHQRRTSWVVALRGSSGELIYLFRTLCHISKISCTTMRRSTGCGQMVLPKKRRTQWEQQLTKRSISQC